MEEKIKLTKEYINNSVKQYDHKKIVQILWTIEEEDIMRTHYEELGPKIIKLLPNRSACSIRGKAGLMGLRKMHLAKKLNLTETEKAYIAGIVDGEGYIGMIKGWRNTGRQYFTPVIKISNTDIRIIDWLKDKLEGLNLFNDVKPETETQKKVNNLQISGPPSVQALLEQIYPYMIIKKDKAEVIMQFTSTRINKPISYPYDIDPMPIATKLNQMNKKGPIRAERS